MKKNNKNKFENALLVLEVVLALLLYFVAVVIMTGAKL